MKKILKLPSISVSTWHRSGLIVRTQYMLVIVNQ